VLTDSQPKQSGVKCPNKTVNRSGYIFGVSACKLLERFSVIRACS